MLIDESLPALVIIVLDIVQRVVEWVGLSLIQNLQNGTSLRVSSDLHFRDIDLSG